MVLGNIAGSDRSGDDIAVKIALILYVAGFCLTAGFLIVSGKAHQRVDRIWMWEAFGIVIFLSTIWPIFWIAALSGLRDLAKSRKARVTPGPS
jgi:hypothetical protein